MKYIYAEIVGALRYALEINTMAINSETAALLSLSLSRSHSHSNLLLLSLSLSPTVPLFSLQRRVLHSFTPTANKLSARAKMIKYLVISRQMIHFTLPFRAPRTTKCALASALLLPLSKEQIYIYISILKMSKFSALEGIHCVCLQLQRIVPFTDAILSFLHVVGLLFCCST